MRIIRTPENYSQYAFYEKIAFSIHFIGVMPSSLLARFLGLHWAGYIELDQGYNWDPAALVEGITQADILGVESPLWSETVTNIDEIEYMAFPRLIGHSEIGWSRASQRSWNDYKERLIQHLNRLELMGVDYYRSPLLKE